ncbi:aminotransferase [Maricurvus nonylphenolicus]|uniref:aminotransferase n=1 Tax=Maricurvus nonylphenolicus TaxID=1008307 RepID=UPI0036F27279
MSNAPKNQEGQAIWSQDKEHFIHPYTDYATFKEEGSHVISEGSGNYLTDADGNRYLDTIAGLWCTNIGHGRTEMADAIAEQVMKMEYCNPFGHSTNEPGSVLAAKLAELAPGDLNHVFYTCGGSTANDAAIRLVHFYNNQRGKPNKKKIISRMDAYHGSTYIAANLTGIHGTKYSFDRIADEWVEHISPANMYRRPVGAEDLSEDAFCDFLVAEFENRILQLGPDNVAAFIAEPVMGAGGVLVAPKGYHRRMRDICTQYDMLYIADEVVTAFGRLGHWFASEAVYDCVPDIIVSAKGISSGYIPLGAAIISSKVYDVISQPQCEGGLLSMGFTYSGHPVACAAALKNIEIIEREKLNENVQALTPYFYELANGLMDISVVGDVRGSHFMMAIEFVTDRRDKVSFPAEADISNRIYQHCLARGMIIRPLGNQIVLSPPLTLTQDDVERLFTVLRESILAAWNDINEAGLLE